MAEWFVRLEGHQFDLMELGRQLTSPELNFTTDDDGYWLRSTRFTPMTDSSEVHATAEQLLQQINGAGRIFSGDFRPVRQAGIQRRHKDGRRDQFVFAQGMASGRSMVFAAASVAGGTPQPQPIQLNDLTFAALHAQGDEAVARALRILGSREPDWVNLYRVFEIVKADISSSISAKGWATKTQIGRFKHTVNSVGAIGDDARHGAEHGQPPKNPMPLEEAQGLIRSILRAWVSSKRPA